MAELTNEQVFELKRMEMEMLREERANERENQREEKEKEREHELAMRRLDPEQNSRRSSVSDVNSTAGRETAKDLPELRHDDDIVDYLNTVEKLCVAYRWPKEVWATRIASRLQGKAREAYSRMPEEEILDYEKVKRAILKKYALTIVCYSTKYVECIPLSSMEASKIARCLTQFFCRVGLPKEIVSDQGTSFINKLYAELCHQLKINHIVISPYHPQASGQVEVYNGVIKQILTKLVSQDGEEWDDVLPYALAAINSSVNTTTGFSPFELMYTYPVRTALDVIRDQLEGEERSDAGVDVIDYVTRSYERIKNVMELARRNVQASQSKQKTYYDKNARNRQFKVGDRVLVLLPTNSEKLLCKWQGPFEIINRTSDVTYELDIPDKSVGRRRAKTYHVNMLKLYNERQPIIAVVGGAITPNVPPGEPIINNQLRPEEELQLNVLIAEYSDVFKNKPGKAKGVKCKLTLKDNTPVRKAPYRVPLQVQSWLRDELREMEESGLIRRSSSPYASPVVVVQRPNRSPRLVVDYRDLNSRLAHIDPYPMPRIDELVGRIAAKRYITVLDQCKGYWQVEMEEESVQYTAFVCGNAHYEMLRMPMGISVASATYQRLVDTMLIGCEEFACSYVDDLCVYSNNFNEHLIHLKIVLDRLRESGLTCRPSKCTIGNHYTDYLGFKIGSGTVGPTDCKVEAIKDLPLPNTKKELRSVLGVLGYYRSLVKNYSDIAFELNLLLKKESRNPLTWNENTERSFTMLKNALISKPVLRSPDMSKSFVLHTDASNHAIGAVLSQQFEDGEHPIMYISRQLNKHERKYSTLEKELLSIVYAVKCLKPYLYLSKFCLKTDHKPLQWLKNNQNNNSRLYRWSLALQEYNFDSQYISGKTNVVADHLSRYPAGSLELFGPGNDLF